MIYLVRHGETNWNIEKKTQGHTDIPLNDTGIYQAELVSDIIKDFNIKKIYSSDLLRTLKTAEIINKNFKFDILTDNRLREIMYGDLEGVPRPKLSKDIWNVFNYEPEKLHAESVSSVYDRVKSFFDELNHEEDVLIVTHGGTMRMIMYYMDNKEIFNRDLYVKEYSGRKVNNCSIYKFDTINNSLNIISIL